ncbi:MAG: T9SS type A sorting domain-containing protein [Saprospiraceae bacterium]|nr:T9SS type A sorting domain-containing protein [Saprospiraceae bacterium]
MKKILLYSFLQILAFQITAQKISMDPVSIDYSFDSEISSKKINYVIRNASDLDFNWTWTIEKRPGFPAEWEAQVCDIITCWLWNIHEQPNNQGFNTLAPGDTTSSLQYVNVQNNGVAGTGTIKFCVYKSFDYENTTPEFCSMISTSFSETELLDVKIYPNPVSENLFIENFSDIENIRITTLEGRKVLQTKDTRSGFVDVSQLNSGIYFLNVLRKDGQQYNATKFTKL